MSNGALQAAKNLGIKYNVSIRVIDEPTGRVVSEHVGHNAATNTLLTGIAHYLAGESLTGQVSSIMHQWIPQYISLGTMGLTYPIYIHYTFLLLSPHIYLHILLSLTPLCSQTYTLSSQIPPHTHPYPLPTHTLLPTCLFWRFRLPLCPVPSLITGNA